MQLEYCILLVAVSTVVSILAHEAINPLSGVPAQDDHHHDPIPSQQHGAPVGSHDGNAQQHGAPAGGQDGDHGHVPIQTQEHGAFVGNHGGNPNGDRRVQPGHAPPAGQGNQAPPAGHVNPAVHSSPPAADIPSGGHHGQHGGRPGAPSHHGMDSNAVHDVEHMRQHMHGKVAAEEKVSEEELQFQYFKVHDYDNNNKLDGVEIISALTHHEKEQSGEKAPQLSEHEISESVDAILLENDLNKDGYIDYPEFIVAQRAASS